MEKKKDEEDFSKKSPEEMILDLPQIGMKVILKYLQDKSVGSMSKVNTIIRYCERNVVSVGRLMTYLTEVSNIKEDRIYDLVNSTLRSVTAETKEEMAKATKGSGLSIKDFFEHSKFMKVSEATVISSKKLNSKEEGEVSALGVISVKIADVVREAMEADGIKNCGKGRCMVRIEKNEDQSAVKSIIVKLDFGGEGVKDGDESFRRK